ncbi:MAG: thioredoxin family protein [Acidobacteriota bacterium]
MTTRYLLRVAACFGALLLLPTLAFGQPSDAVFSGFVPNSDFTFELDGAKLDNVEVFFAQRIPAYLIVAPPAVFAQPLLVEPRTRMVKRVPLMKMLRKGDGSVDILADAVFRPVGPIQLDGKSVTFTVDGQSARLAERPDIVGDFTGAELRVADPGYAFAAEQYTTDSAVIAKLRSEQRDVKVTVFFGSWCPFCKRHLPYMLGVEEALGDSKIAFDYVGLPKNLDNPRAKAKKVRGVPTAVITVNGKEVGRVTNQGWNKPESALSSLLGGT